MDRRRLQHTDLEVSRLCCGTMTFGKPVEQSTATRMVNRCLEAGINFFDTANIYQLGVAETLLGMAIQGKRDKVILASKVYGPMGHGIDERGLSESAIERAVEATLQRLRTDYLDIYYLHQPDGNIPMEETLLAMDRLVRQGKIRYVATSNYASWQVAKMFSLAETLGLQPPFLAQPMYNLLSRGIEQEFLPMAMEFDVSIIAFNPLAGGLLTGKHNSASVVEGTRFDQNKMYQDRYWNQQNFDAVERLRGASVKAGRSLISVALNWLLHHSTTDCLILGASRLDQLEENLAAAAEGPLPPDVLNVCDGVWQQLRGPSPVYNR